MTRNFYNTKKYFLSAMLFICIVFNFCVPHFSIIEKSATDFRRCCDVYNYYETTFDDFEVTKESLGNFFSSIGLSATTLSPLTRRFQRMFVMCLLISSYIFANLYKFLKLNLKFVDPHILKNNIIKYLLKQDGKK